MNRITRDGTDYAGNLWQLLREPDRRRRPKHDPGLLREAAELVVRSGDDESFVPMSFSTERFADWLVRQTSRGRGWNRARST